MRGLLTGPRLLTSMVVAGFAALLSVAQAADLDKPWTRPDRALVIDAYEYNQLDWSALTRDKRIAGFINKASDGLAPAYHCAGDEQQYRLCKALWYRHAVARELYQTRRILAKSLGLKWGAYHLARPGNPVQQAQNFLDFARPEADELMAVDIEDNDPGKWMSLEDAEIFVAEIRRRTGRYPVLYTNGNTAKHIADAAARYPVLSRLQLWYARYKPEVAMHFPKGNWDSYALWQFVSQVNCNRRSCPMRIEGANLDIDINVADMTPDELRAAWPFDTLVAPKTEVLVAETVPVPFPRELALEGEAPVRYASVDAGGATSFGVVASLASAYVAQAAGAGQSAIERLLGRPGLDMTKTASIPAPAAAPPAFDRAAAPVMLLRDGEGESFAELFLHDPAPRDAARLGPLLARPPARP